MNLIKMVPDSYISLEVLSEKETNPLWDLKKKKEEKKKNINNTVKTHTQSSFISYFVLHLFSEK